MDGEDRRCASAGVTTRLDGGMFAVLSRAPRGGSRGNVLVATGCVLRAVSRVAMMMAVSEIERCYKVRAMESAV